MTKRIASLLLALTLMISLTPPGRAQEGTVSADLMTDEGASANSMALHKGELLIAAMDGVYAYKPGNSQARLVVRTERGYLGPQEEAGDYFDLLLADGDQLYGYQMTTGKLMPLSLEGEKLTFGESVTMDLSSQRDEFDGASHFRIPEQVLMDGGRFYILYKNYEVSGPSTVLLSFDAAAGGAPAVVDAPHVQRLSSYQDGLLLALVLDENDAYDEKTGQMRAPSISTLDPASGRLTELAASAYPYEGGSVGIAYDPATNTIYETGRGEVTRRDAQGKAEVCAYLGSSQLWGFHAGQVQLIDSDTIAVGSTEGVFVRGTDPSKLPAMRLTIYGSFESAEHRKAAQAMNGVPLNYLNSKWFASAQELGQALVSGEDGVDLLFLSGREMDLQMLMQKGYAADLSASQVLRDYVAGLYPDMQQASGIDGRLLMVPVSLGAQVLGYYPHVFEKVGLDVPQSYDDLVALFAGWSGERAQEHPDVLPLAHPDFTGFLLNQAISLYASHCDYTGEEFSFSSPLLMDMMRRALEADTRDLDTALDFDSPDAHAKWNELYEKDHLLDNFGMIDLQNLTQLEFSRDEERRYTPYPLALAVKEGEPGITPVNLTFLVVNPKSKHLDAAIRYAEHYVQALDPAMLAMLNPSLNEAVEDPDWETIARQMDEGLASYEAAAERAEGAEKTEMLALAREYRENIAQYKERTRWKVTANAIRTYRQFMEHRTIGGYDLTMMLGQEGMVTLIMRLAKRQMPLEQFASEADAMLRLIRLENQ